MIRFLIVCGCSFICTNVLACTCFPSRPISVDALLANDLVFEGRVLELDTVYAEYRGQRYPESIMATFKVDLWISARDAADTLIIYTGLGGGDCGLGVAIGDKWIIFSYERDGIQFASVCSSSMKMFGDKDKDFVNSLAYLQRLKSLTGHIQENVAWDEGPYKVFGTLSNGKPLGQWIRARGSDTIAIFNFNSDGIRHGYQMEWDEMYDQKFEEFIDASPETVRTFSPDGKELRSVY